MAVVEYQPQQGQLQLSVAEQSSVDWSMLINGRIINGILQTRPGWEILHASSSCCPGDDAGLGYRTGLSDIQKLIKKK